MTTGSESLIMTRQYAPGPANGPFGIRHIYSCNTWPLEFYERLGKYGDLATFRMFGVRVFLINSPTMIHEVLRDTGTRFRKLPRNMKMLARGLGKGLLVADGDDWLATRRLVQPSLNRRALETVVTDAVPRVEALLDRWSCESDVELFTEMNRVTVDIAARVLLGIKLEEEAQQIGAAARTLAESWAHATRQVVCLPNWIPLPRQRRERNAIRFLRSTIDTIIRQRRKWCYYRPDLLSRLVAAYDQSPGGPSANHEALIDQVLTLFTAAYHASTVTLCWTFFLLNRHPLVHGRVEQEIADVLADCRPTLAGLKQLVNTENVLKESMRLYPSAWELFPREAIEATQLGDWKIPLGAWLLLSPYVTQRDARFFENPLTFDPNRWAPGRVESIDPHAYFPFGGGRHVCVGREMAMAQNMLTLAMVLQRYRFQFTKQDHVPDRLPPLALVPRDPMWISLTPRSGRLPDAEQESSILAYN